MDDLQLENIEIQQDLNTIFCNIGLGAYGNDAEIIQELQICFKYMCQTDQKKVLSYIHQAYSSHTFVERLQLQQNQLETNDFQTNYKTIIQEEEFLKLSELLKNQEIWKEIKTLSKFTQYKSILLKLESRIIDFLVIAEAQQNNIIISQYQYISKLLGFIYDKPKLLSIDEQKIFEAIIGSLLTQQIFEFQDYIEQLKNNDEAEFNNFLLLLQMKQTKLTNEPVIKLKFKTIFSLLSQDITRSKINLDQFFLQIFQIQEQEINYNEIQLKLDEALRSKSNFHDCYFYVVIYYWIQHCQQFGIKEKVPKFYEQNQRIKSLENKIKHFENFITSQKSNDEINIFLYRRVVLFTYSLEKSISLESYKKHQKTQTEYQLFRDDFQSDWFQIYQNQTNKELISFQQAILKLEYQQIQRSAINNNFKEVEYLFILFLWKGPINFDKFQFSKLFLEAKINILEIAYSLEQIFTTKKGQIIDLLTMVTIFFKLDQTNLIFLKNIFFQFGSLSIIKAELLELIMYCHQLLQNNKIQEFKDSCLKIYKQSKEVYIRWLEPFDYFKIFSIRPEVINQCLSLNQYPKKMNITLEQFNISFAHQSEEEKQTIIEEWILQMNSQHAFSKLIPFFFNIIKRGDAYSSFTTKIYKCFEKLGKQKQFLNMKALFQLFYNNSEEELKVMILKLWSKQYPVPLVFQNNHLKEINNEEDLYALNHYLYYITPQCFTIINLTLSQRTSQIGKTELINKIFYRMRKFEIQDTCEINNNTIDIMFDFCFKESRHLAVADTHSILPISILQKILPFFQCWIIQLDSESELEYNFDQIKFILEREKKIKPIICLIVRNSEPQLNQQFSSVIQNIQSFQPKINLHFMLDLNKKGLNQLSQQIEIDRVQKLLFDLIKPYIEQKQYRNNQDFSQIIKSFEIETNQKDLIYKTEKIINQLKEELDYLIHQQDGFLSESAFPIRNILYKIKQTKQKISEIYQSVSPPKEQIKELTIYINDLERQLSLQTPTKLVYLFIEALQLNNFQIVYLKFSEIVQQFNLQHTLKIQQQISDITEKLSQIKMLKKAQKNNQETQNEFFVNQIEEKSSQLQSLIRQEMFQYIDIQLFWRELITIQQYCQKQQISIQLVSIVYDLLKKGESFEFLDGDNLQINCQFLKLLAEKFKEQKEGEKVLVLSVLGPQSSGKSTILNKIFGCHFLTSSGRCTKGINMQLVKIQNTTQFNDLFDYVLILDSEGLQSPNKNDPEFDKKIALLILSMSDIILITVIGSMTIQFRDLIEMCIYTLGLMKSSFSYTKLLSWCFNLQNDLLNKSNFQKEFESLMSNLNNGQTICDEEEKIDYSDILDINEQSIQLLGIASTVETWKKNEDTGVFQEWLQSIINQSFSSQAYNYGLQIITQFSKKFANSANKELTNLQNVISNIYNNWESLIILPDLLEFSELKSFQNNDLMRKSFENTFRSQDISFIQNIAIEIRDEIKKLKKQSLVHFNSIQKQKEEEIKCKLNSILQIIKETLLNTKNKYTISKKITQKYLEQLDLRILHLDYECRFIILEQIKGFERDYQEKEGFQSIDNFVYTLHPETLKIYQTKTQNIVQKFNELWEQISQDLGKQNQQIFQEFQQNQFQQIKQAFKQYVIITEEEQKYLDYFSSHLNTKDPFQSSNQEQEEIYQLFVKDQIQQQFIVFDFTKKKFFSELFIQPIRKKLKSIQTSNSSQLLNLNEYLEIQLELTLISKKILIEYFQHGFNKDLIHFLSKDQTSPKDIDNFLKPLMAFQMKFDESIYQKLINKVFEKEKTQTYANFDKEQLMNYCDEFSKTLSFQENIEIKLKKSDSTYNSLQTYYPNILRLIEKQTFTNIQDITDIKKFKRESMKQSIIIRSRVSIEPSQSIAEHLVLFQYIISPQNNQQYQSVFREKFPQLFYEMMKNQNGWREFYHTIYQLIKKEMTPQSRLHVNQQEYQIFSINKISQLMLLIEAQVKKYRYQICLFGVLFTNVSERFIYYSCLFIIWRFICYQKWKILQVQEFKLQQMKDSQMKKFQAEILENKEEQSIIKAQILAENILKGIMNNFYYENSSKFQQNILSNNQSSFQLIQYLDKKFLQKHSLQQQDDIIDYIMDQKSFIIKFVQNKIEVIKKQNLDEFKEKLLVKLQQIMRSILQNISNLINQVTHKQKSKEYFKALENQNEQFFEGSLFQIVWKCIQGEQSDQFIYLEDCYKDIFRKNLFISVVIPQDNIQPIYSNNQIQLLKPFIEELKQQIVNINSNLKNIKLDFSLFGAQDHLDQLKNNMIGCLETCPLCNRKCDQQIELGSQKHKHMCLNGHQLRGMNEVFIDNKPSLCTCEEIDKDDMILIKELNKLKSWSDIKSIYSEWKFHKFKNDNSQNLIQALMNVWNSNIGKLICNKMSLKFNKNINYEPRYFNQRLYQKSIHCIFVLDCSGSMVNRWNDIRKAVIDSLKAIQDNKNAKVSLITFNHEAKIIIDCQNIDSEEQQKKIIQRYGDTNFQEAFKAISNQIQKVQIDQFSKTIILFYTDCEHDEVSYPENELQQLTQLIQSKQLNFLACTNKEMSPVVTRIINYLRLYINNAELKQSIDGNLIRETFVEKISNKNLRF